MQLALVSALIIPCAVRLWWHARGVEQMETTIVARLEVSSQLQGDSASQANKDAA